MDLRIDSGRLIGGQETVPAGPLATFADQTASLWQQLIILVQTVTLAALTGQFSPMSAHLRPVSWSLGRLQSPTAPRLSCSPSSGNSCDVICIDESPTSSSSQWPFVCH